MRSRVLIVWLLLLVLVGVIAIAEYRDRVEPASERDGEGLYQGRSLLPVPVEQLGAVEMGHLGVLHRFERDAAGTWFYHGVHTGSEQQHAHQADPQQAQRIAQALSAFGRAKTERQFPVERAKDYGVTAPQLLILVYRPNELQPLVQYAVGDLAPDKLSRYVLALGSPVVVTIPNYQIDNLLALLQAVGGEPDSGTAKS